MTLVTPVMEKFILHWGEMGSRWGVNRSVAQIHALLYLSQDPLPAEALAEALGIARSNVSNSLKELLAYQLIGVVHVRGDRRDHFRAELDPWEILLRIAEERKKREIDPALAMLRDCVAEAEASRADPVVRERLATMLGFMEEIGGWYEQVKRLPRTTLAGIVRLGARIGGLIRA